MGQIHAWNQSAVDSIVFDGVDYYRHQIAPTLKPDGVGDFVDNRCSVGGRCASLL